MATSSSATLRDTLVHLKKKLERTTDEDALLQIIHKLSKVPITTDLLQGTGAGKIIRTMSKKPGKVGQKASSLLNKWREIVAGNQNSNEKPKQNHSSLNSKSIENHSSSKLHEKEKYVKEKHSKEKHISIKDNNVKDTSAKLSNTNGHLKDKHNKHKGIKEHTSEKHLKEKHAKEKYLKEHSKSGEQKHYSKENKHKYIPTVSEKAYSNDEFNGADYSSSDELAYDPEKVILKNKEVFRHESSEEDSVSYEPTPKKHKKDIGKNKEMFNHKSASYEPTPKKHEKIVKNKEVFSHKSSEEDSVSYEPTQKKHEKVTVKNKEVFSHKLSEEDSVSYEPALKKDKSKHISKEEKVKIKTSSDFSASKMLKESHSSHLHKNSSHESKSSEKVHKKHKSSSGSDKQKSKEKSSNKQSDSKKSKKNLKLEQTEAFTSSETTFEDCLGFNDIVPLKKKKSSKPPSSSSSSLKSPSKPKKSVSTLEILPTPVKYSLSPVDRTSDQDLSDEAVEVKDFKKEVSLQSTLPPTQPFYRPLPQKSYEDYIPVKKKAMSNEDAIKFTSSRREKTAVYSGRKNCFLTEVPSLFECCTRVLIDNIDGIEYMGEVPYFLLEPMLKRCSASQLYRIEHFNPSLLEDSDQLWEVHCRRDYRSAKPQENETWRELYLRTKDEQEQRLRNVTANISASIANSNPVRKAKLAYIDSVVKPPRDVARRQAKHGTALTTSHSAKPNSPAKISSTSTTTPVTPAHAASSNSVTVVSSSKAREIKAQKPKIAPLMAKTLKSMKKCFRR